MFQRNAFLFFFFLTFLKKFIYLWLCWVFVSVQGLSLVAASGSHSSSRCAASPVAEHRLQTRRLSNCGPRAQLLRGTWDLPRPGLEPISPAPAGRLSTTAPPGNPRNAFLKVELHIQSDERYSEAECSTLCCSNDLIGSLPFHPPERLALPFGTLGTTDSLSSLEVNGFQSVQRTS